MTNRQPRPDTCRAGAFHLHRYLDVSLFFRYNKAYKTNFLLMNLRPLGDRLIISADSKEEKTASGLLLPETASKERPEQGEVIAIGPGRLDEKGNRVPMSVKVGDMIVFKKYSPDEVKVGEQEYLVIAESDVLAVIEK